MNRFVIMATMALGKIDTPEDLLVDLCTKH